MLSNQNMYTHIEHSTTWKEMLHFSSVNLVSTVKNKDRDINHDAKREATNDIQPNGDSSEVDLADLANEGLSKRVERELRYRGEDGGAGDLP